MSAAKENQNSAFQQKKHKGQTRGPMQSIGLCSPDRNVLSFDMLILPRSIF